MLRMVSVPVCGVCNGSHENDATCPAYAKKGRDSAPSTADAESLIIEMQSMRAAPIGPGSMLGPYKLIEEIGAGGMGRVFRALDTALERPVAVKVINPEFLLGNKQAAERFFSEARLTARIRHRNVVPVYHLGTDTGGNPFLVMELLEGRTLTAALKARERFPLSRVVSIGTQVLAALAAAHAHLVHRDLKPGNIFLTPQPDGDELVTVLDFGVAKALKDAGADLTRQQKLVIGTRSYSAPEMLLGTGTRDDPRQDLYSLGVVLFLLASGKLPWTPVETENLEKLLREGRKPRRLRDVAPDVDPFFAEVVDRALAVGPAERWQSATDFRTALQSFGIFVPGALISETYRIERQLGKGGMSVVYLAHDVRMERACALKALLVTHDDDPTGTAGERFRRDGALAKDVRHPNVVEVYAQGAWHGRPYIVTEYVDGKTLREHLRAADWPSLVAVVQQIASALDAVHEAGIVHRDVKPENILVDARGVAKLVDFGFARRASSELTAAGIGLGSFGYMAPEQAADPTSAGAASDEWSLAAIVYEALTGQRPFYEPGDPADPAALEGSMDRLLNLTAPESPEKLNPSISPALATVIVRALSQDVSLRFPTSTAFAEALAGAPSVGLRLKASTRPEDGTPGPIPSGELVSAVVTEPPPTKERRSLRIPALLAVLILAGVGGTAVVWLRSSRQPAHSEIQSTQPVLGEAADASRAAVLSGPDAAARAESAAFPDAGAKIDEPAVSAPQTVVPPPPTVPPAPKHAPARRSHRPSEKAPAPQKKPDPATDKEGTLKI